MGAADVLIGIVPVILAVAFILLIARSMGDRSTGMVDRMKQAVGGTVMLLVALMVVFAFTGGGGDSPDPEPTESYDVHFYVATDSAGYGTVSASVLRDVAAGTSVTVGQTISVGGAGQCTATPSASTDQYEYAFAGWTGADDADTPAPTSIAADTAYYAHFTRTETGPTPMDPALFTYTVENGEATITGWAGEEPAAGYDLVIPTTDGQGHPVVAVVGLSGPDDPTPFPNVGTVYGSSVETIGVAAFLDCAYLTSVEFPSVTEIGEVAFMGCDYLASVEFPSLTEITDFQQLPITSASFPAATSIGNSAFANCTALESISIPLVETIDGGAFRWCTALESISLPAATSIGGTAFRDCTALESIVAPAATSIGGEAFRDCTALESVSLPAVTSVAYSAFASCTAITSVALGPLTGTLDDSAFQSWTFYDTDGTTVLQPTAANLANSTFQGVYNALVKVPAGQQSLTREMEQRVLELSAENSLKASMLAELDPELADMDPSDVARMTISEIESMTADDVRAIKSSLPSRSG